MLVRGSHCHQIPKRYIPYRCFPFVVIFNREVGEKVQHLLGDALDFPSVGGDADQDRNNTFCYRKNVDAAGGRASVKIALVLCFSIL